MERVAPLDVGLRRLLGIQVGVAHHLQAAALARNGKFHPAFLFQRVRGVGFGIGELGQIGVGRAARVETLPGRFQRRPSPPGRPAEHAESKQPAQEIAQQADHGVPNNSQPAWAFLNRSTSVAWGGMPATTSASGWRGRRFTANRGRPAASSANKNACCVSRSIRRS